MRGLRDWLPADSTYLLDEEEASMQRLRTWLPQELVASTAEGLSQGRALQPASPGSWSRSISAHTHMRRLAVAEHTPSPGLPTSPCLTC